MKLRLKKFALTKDQVTVFAAGIVQNEVLDEKWDGHYYWLKAKLMADPGEVVKSIDVLRKDQQKTKELVEMKRHSDELFA